jgi:hypothetical protein
LACRFPVVCTGDLSSSVTLLKVPNKSKDYVYCTPANEVSLMIMW